MRGIKDGDRRSERWKIGGSSSTERSGEDMMTASDSKDENRTGDEQYVSLSQLCEDIY